MATATHGVAAKAHIEAVLGGTGTGKSSYVKQQLRKRPPKRLLVFDPEEEWGEFGRVTGSLQDVIAGCEAAKATGGLRIVFVPSPDPATAMKQFDVFCRIAFAAERTKFVVDELKLVTTPSRSPVGWGMLTGRGRKRGIEIYGLSQRPASIDKDFLGNCTAVRTGRLTYRADQEAVAKVLGVPESEIASLPDLAWIRRDMATGQLTRGAS